MQVNEITIKITNDRIYLNPVLSLSIEETNIPMKHLTFHSHKDIFWNVEILEYNTETNCLRVFVKDYNIKNIQDFNNQEPNKKIDKLLFEKWDWKELEPLLRFYHKNRFLDMLFNTETMSNLDDEKGISKLIKNTGVKQSITSSILQEQKPLSQVINLKFSTSFNKVQFKQGHVILKKYINEVGHEVEFKIFNDYILSEFDVIKYWFAKKLKSNKINIEGTIVITNNLTQEVKAKSTQIDQITPELIDNIKYQRTLNLTKEPIVNIPDKSIFTTDDIFKAFSTNNLEANVFNQSEEDILNLLINKNSRRNKKQLEYLSSKKQSEHYKLRYTLKPNFGFLFFSEGSENNHFIWELLNSHATYIWSINKKKQNIEMQFERIEATLNTIRTYGREWYKNNYRDNPQENDIIFRVINHTSINSAMADGFSEWKDRLNEQLL